MWLNKCCYLVLLLLLLNVINSNCKKISKGRSGSSSRGSNRKTNYNPQPTSHSYSSQQASKSSLSGWQQKPAQSPQTQGSSQSHSYPSSQTGLSGNSPKQHIENNGGNNKNSPGVGYPSQQGSGLSGNAPKQQDSFQKTNTYSQNSGQNTQHYPNQQSNTNQNNGYPASSGLSGNSGTGVRNPSQQGLPPYNSGNNYPANNYGNNYHHPQGAPPPYSGHLAPNYGGYGGGHGGYSGNGHNMPGYFGNYGNSGGMSRSRSALTGVGIAGAGVGTLLTGLALWNLARSTGQRHHTVIYDNRGQPVAVNATDNSSSNTDSILGDLVNCTLTISNGNTTEILAIPCAIATSFTPNADVKELETQKNSNENTTCTITVVNKVGSEFMTTIPCSLLLNTAAENNVTEAPTVINNGNQFDVHNENKTDSVFSEQQAAVVLNLTNTTDSTSIDAKNCSSFEVGDNRDPINPCYSVSSDLTVQPLLLSNDTVPSTLKPIL